MLDVSSELLEKSVGLFNINFDLFSQNGEFIFPIAWKKSHFDDLMIPFVFSRGIYVGFYFKLKQSSIDCLNPYALISDLMLISFALSKWSDQISRFYFILICKLTTSRTPNILVKFTDMCRLSPWNCKSSEKDFI